MFQNKIQLHDHSKSTSSWNVILLKDMGEGEAFTVLFSKVTAADIKKKKKIRTLLLIWPRFVVFFFFYKRPKNRMTVSAISAYKGTLVV